MKIAYQGQRGSYAEAAAAWMFAEHDIATIGCASAQAVVDAVIDGSCQYGVLRLETSDWGANYELINLLRATRVYYTRDIRFHERFNLAGKPGARREAIRRIYAHPAIMMLCSNYLGRIDGGDAIARFDSAQQMAERILRGDGSEAIACSDFAAGIFGLRILQGGIENTVEGTARFVALAAQKESPLPEVADACTAILFELKHRPGALMEALACFKAHNINLTAMVARPTRTSKWDCGTYAEFAGRYDDDDVRAALAELRGHTTYLQLLGSFYGVEPRVPTV